LAPTSPRSLAWVPISRAKIIHRPETSSCGVACLASPTSRWAQPSEHKLWVIESSTGRIRIDDQVFEIRIFADFRPARRKADSRRPFFAHRRKRMNTLLHLPNSSGRSRHGAPAGTSHNTASTNKRLSTPCLPLSPFLHGISGSIVQSVNCEVGIRSPCHHCDRP
jgi:hypothetical protein